jgi:hypothetical protein
MSTNIYQYPLSGNVTYAIGSGSSGYYNTYNTAIGAQGSAGWTTLADNTSTVMSIKGQALTVTGDAEITGNLTVDGTNITSVLNDIRDRLGLLTRNLELEQDFDQLRDLANQYRELESRLKEKKQMWDILKKE